MTLGLLVSGGPAFKMFLTIKNIQKTLFLFKRNTMERGGYVYILTNSHNNVLYIGVTSSLYFRIKEHIEAKDKKSFTFRYNCNKLVFYEFYPSIEEAIAKEKQLKNWHQNWKKSLIDDFNPTWQNHLDQVVDL